MTFWLLVISFWIHLLATVVWLGGLSVSALIALPALRRGTLQDNQWLELQKRLQPWVFLSLVILLITGFYQMTNNPEYSGFLALDGLWAWAILLKHIAYGGMVLVTVYLQFGLYPAINRLNTLSDGRSPTIESQQQSLAHREVLLLRVNLVCAVLVLLFTAVATAV